MKRYIPWLKVLVAIALFYALLKTDTIDFNHMAGVTGHPWMLLIAAMCLFAGIIIGALRCTLLLRAAGIDIKTSTVLRLQLIGSLFSTVLPGAAGGDAVRATYLYRLLPSHRMIGLLALGIDRIFSLFGLVALTCILLWANFSHLSQSPALVSYTIWASVVFAISIAAGIAAYIVARFLKIPVLKIQWLERLRPYVRQIRNAILVYRQRWLSIILCFVFSLLGSFVVVAGIVAISQAFSFAPGVYVTALAGVIGNISSAIPLTPGGIGIGEAVFAKICSDLMVVVAPYATIYLVFRLMMALVSLPGLLVYISFDIENNRVNSPIMPSSITL